MDNLIMNNSSPLQLSTTLNQQQQQSTTHSPNNNNITVGQQQQNNNTNNNNTPIISSQQQHLNNNPINTSTTTIIGNGGGMGTNNGNTQVLQELFRQQQQHLQSSSSLNHYPQVLNNNHHFSSHAHATSLDSNNLNSHSSNDYNLIFNMAMGGHTNNEENNQTAAAVSDDFMMQQMSMLSQQSQQMMQPHHHHHHQQHYSNVDNSAASAVSMGLSPVLHHQNTTTANANVVATTTAATSTTTNCINNHHHHHLTNPIQMQQHHSAMNSHHSNGGGVSGIGGLQVGQLSNFANGIQDNILNFLGGGHHQQENDNSLVVHVDQSNHHHDNHLLMNQSGNNQMSHQNHSNVQGIGGDVGSNSCWRGDKVNFSYFDHSTPSSVVVVDNMSQLHSNTVGNATSHLDEVVIGSSADSYSHMKRNHSLTHYESSNVPSTSSSTTVATVANNNNGLQQVFNNNNENVYNQHHHQMNGTHLLNNYSTQAAAAAAMMQNHQLNQSSMMTSQIIKKQTKLSPNNNNEEGKEVTNCHCCGRSDAEVSFKKNYSIHEGNIESYRNTFPQNIDQITSGPVCATCYNKQWRFQRGLYDPQKLRKANPREGLKQKLKDCDSTGSPLTPTLAMFPLNNRVSAIQSDYSPTNSPRTNTPTFKNKRKLTVSTCNTNPGSLNNGSVNSGDFIQSIESNDPEFKRSKYSSGMESLSYRNKNNPDEISIIVQFYQVDNEVLSDSSTLVDQINEFNQAQLRIQKQQMFGIHPNEKDCETSKYFNQFYTTALKVNKKHFDVSQPNLQLVQGKLALENIKQLLTDRAKQIKQTKMDDSKTSTSDNTTLIPFESVSTSENDKSDNEMRVLCVKIISQDRFKNTILADVDEFFFVDKDLSEGDSIFVFLQ